MKAGTTIEHYEMNNEQRMKSSFRTAANRGSEQWWKLIVYSNCGVGRGRNRRVEEIFMDDC